MRAGDATVLNLTVKFGEKNLADFWEAIVWPALSGNVQRTYGDTRYLFIDQKMMELETDQNETYTVVIGTFVKDTVLRSSQVLEDNELVEKRQMIQSSPSATFVILKETHKLIYYAETPHAPSESSFASTLQNFLRRIRQIYINNEHKRLNDIGSPITKKELNSLVPKPDVRVLPLANSASVEQFVSEFSVLKKLKFDVLPSNDEHNAVEMFETVTEASADLDSKATLSFSNSDGLDKDEAEDVLRGASTQAIHKVTANGVGTDGEKLVKTSDDLKVVKSVGDVSQNPQRRARKLTNLFSDILGMRFK